MESRPLRAIVRMLSGRLPLVLRLIVPLSVRLLISLMLSAISLYSVKGSPSQPCPKLAIAEQVLTEPVNIEDANYSELIRVPGIGQITAQKIIARRESKRIKAKELKKYGVIMKRAAPFVKVNGESQLRLSAY